MIFAVGLERPAELKKLSLKWKREEICHSKGQNPMLFKP